MTENPFRDLLKSRKFWLLIMDLVISLTAYFVTKYASPDTTQDVMVVIGALQPIFLIVIGAIAYEDKALIQASQALSSQIQVSQQK